MVPPKLLFTHGLRLCTPFSIFSRSTTQHVHIHVHVHDTEQLSSDVQYIHTTFYYILTCIYVNVILLVII